MTIDPAPETDARPASGGEGDDDSQVSEVVDRTEGADATNVHEPEGDAEAVLPAPFDVEADSETESETAESALPPPPATEVAGPAVDAPSAPPAPMTETVAPVVVAAAAPVGEPVAEAGPVARERRRRARRIKARQVQRVITRVDPWSMLKVSLLFALSMWLIVVVAGVLIWRVAVSTGTISNFENFLAQTLGEDTFTIDGSQIFQGSIVVGLVFFVTGAVFAVVTSVLFNLIAGLVGGVRFTMVELETARPVEEPAAPA